MDFQLYDWQRRCLDVWSANHSRGIVNVVTGAGKTMMALAAMKELEHKLPVPLKVKIIVPKAFMVNQWISAILKHSEFLGIRREEIGCYYGALKDSTPKKYMIFVVNSARYTLSRQVIQDIDDGNAVLLIADECHHYGSEENRKIFDFLRYFAVRKENLSDRYFSLGLSATPQNLYFDSVLVPALGPEIFKYDLSDALQYKTVNPFTIFHVALTFTPDERLEYEDLNEQLLAAMRQMKKYHPYLQYLDQNTYFQTLHQLAADTDGSPSASLAAAILMLMFQRKQLISTSVTRLDCACRLTEYLDKTSKIIIFGEQIDQADELYEMLRDLYPNQVGRYHSDMDLQVRKNILRRYQEGELRILVSCKALDEGLDVPAANVGIILSSTANQRQRIQRLGRILRRTDGEKKVCLYYLYITGTTEQEEFLTFTPGKSTVLKLTYLPKKPWFAQQQYDRCAALMMKDLSARQPESVVQKELEGCLDCGRVRADWILSPKECTEHMQNASSVHEKNYWFCMMKLGKR